MHRREGTTKRDEGAAAYEGDDNIDEREVVDVAMPKVQVVDVHSGHVVLYQINVQNSYSEWTVLKRFKAFAELNNEIQKTYADAPSMLSRLPTLPPKKMKLFVDHLEPAFIDERRKALHVYIMQLLHIPEIASSEPLLRFLGI